MKVKIPRRKNPLSNEKLWWLWVFLLPVAIILWLYYDLKEDSRIRKEKRRIKEAEFNKKHWEYNWWFDDQGL